VQPTTGDQAGLSDLEALRSRAREQDLVDPLEDVPRD
jgi:hypothetical protein